MTHYYRSIFWKYKGGRKFTRDQERKKVLARKSLENRKCKTDCIKLVTADSNILKKILVYFSLLASCLTAKKQIDPFLDKTSLVYDYMWQHLYLKLQVIRQVLR